MTDCDHCWHDTGVLKTGPPLVQIRECCCCHAEDRVRVKQQCCAFGDYNPGYYPSYLNVSRKKMARFWAQWVAEDKRVAFVDTLTKRLVENEINDLYSDYDPDATLCAALADIEIQCRGEAFSARDVGFPDKTGSFIRDGEVLVKQGYGTECLPWKEEIKA